MFITVHTALGAVIGEHTQSAIWAFLLGLVSHFLLDLIPHGDRHLAEGYYSGERIKRMFAAASIDTIVTIIFLVSLFNSQAITNSYLAAWAIAGAVLPDFFVGLYEVTKNKHLAAFNHLHQRFHFYFKKDLPWTYGIILQIVLWLFIKAWI